MAAAIQSVAITGTKDRTSPKPHTVYEISVTTPMRSWQMWRRYSEFVELHDELVKACSAPPPSELPGKHIWSLKSSFHNEALIHERQTGLETYLRTIVASKDPQWRDNSAFRQFLGVPATKYQEAQAAKAAGHGPVFSTASWIEEHNDVQALAREVKASLNKRDSLWDVGDTRASSSANIQAKRHLADLVDRVGNLARGLQSLSDAGLSQGELQRRTDMVTRLQDECEQLGRIVAIARNPNRQPRAPTSADSMMSNQDARSSLLSGPLSRPIARVFGAPQQVPEETAETRPLDDRGLIQLQKQKMADQDSQLDNLSAILQRQMHIGVAISTEIEEQNKILDEMNDDVDRVTGKIKKARKVMATIS
jgi:regulator of vacuolar morphogenesis